MPSPSFELGYLSIQFGVSTQWAKPSPKEKVRIYTNCTDVDHIITAEVPLETNKMQSAVLVIFQFPHAAVKNAQTQNYTIKWSGRFSDWNYNLTQDFE